MSESRLRADMGYLAGSLAHRGSNTQSERTAAEYILNRFRTYTPHCELDEFASIDSFYYLFASFYGEFLIISLLSFWFPSLAVVFMLYGLIVFCIYIAEFTGYRVVSRLLPHYESQNVCARFLCPLPRRLVVVTAHYDSGKETLLSHPRAQRWLRAVHAWLVFSMILVLLSCLALGRGMFEEAAFRWDYLFLAAGLIPLCSAAGLLLYCEVAGDYVRGANGNATGVAVLLDLARRLSAEPPAETDVWLVATGSKEGWLNGMRHLFAEHDFDKTSTYFINLDYVGQAIPRYVGSEGLLHAFHASHEMVKLAEELGGAFGATPIHMRGLPSDALLPLARGYHTLGITSTSLDGAMPHLRRHTDTLNNVDFQGLQTSADFAAALVRKLDGAQALQGFPERRHAGAR